MAEEVHPGFADRCVISCGVLHPEFSYLVATGLLTPRRILFTPPGLHAMPLKLEERLPRRLSQARELYPDHKIIVVYGTNLGHIGEVLAAMPGLQPVYPKHCTGEAAFVALTRTLGPSAVRPFPAAIVLEF